MIKIISFLLLISFLNANEYSQWLKLQNQSYNTYKNDLDKEFTQMLKKEYKAFKTMETPTLYKKPKPKEIPIIKEAVPILKEDIKTSPKINIKDINPKSSQKSKPIIKKKEILNNFQDIIISFYSYKIPIQYDIKSNFYYNKINQDVISEYWDKLSKTNYQPLIKQIDYYTKEFNLNDWARYQFIYTIANEIYNDTNLNNLFTWFILLKQNNDVKVGYSNNNIYLLSSISHKVFQVPFLISNDTKYYILSPNAKLQLKEDIYTYANNYPKAKDKLSFEMKKYIKLNNNIKNKILNFTYNNKKYKIKAQYSKSLIDYYKTFPQSDYKIYFSTTNSTLLNNSLLIQLQPLVKNKSELQAVNLILRFVQTVFKYETDQEQFNYEKVMFPEETIFYPFSDCEDRSIIFSYLVKNLLNLDVVGIKYQDHLATAVKFTSNISGDTIIYKNQKYTISDPTYINANVGMTMPQYKHSDFEIIAF